MKEEERRKLYLCHEIVMFTQVRHLVGANITRESGALLRRYVAPLMLSCNYWTITKYGEWKTNPNKKH